MLRSAPADHRCEGLDKTFRITHKQPGCEGRQGGEFHGGEPREDGISRAQGTGRVEVLELGSELSRPVRKVSLGQRMMAELIAALLHRHEVQVLDEPTLGLDVNAQTRERLPVR